MVSREISVAFETFGRDGEPVSVNQIVTGLINKTYLIETDKREKYILQKINTFVFRNPKELMENIIGVTKHLSEKIKENGGDSKRETLNFLPVGDRYFFCDENGGVWRMYIYVDNSFTYNKPKSADTLRSAGSAFGRFMKLLSDYPAEALHETVKNFHHTPSRYESLMTAYEKDIMSRSAEVKNEIEFVRIRKSDTHKLTDLIEKGELPLRVTHNDTKLNNILFDIDTDESLCIIDLDTIMPGLSLYDFGDSIRSGASVNEEDNPEIAFIDLNLFEAYVDGFLRETACCLTDREIESLAFGAKLMTLECGIRFLTDYLEGDVYFRTDYPGHNLSRTKNQFALVKDMEKNMDKMNGIVQKYKEKYRK